MLRNIIADLKPLFQVPVVEAKQFMEWVKAYSWKTQFNPVVMSHPRMVMATAYDEKGPLLYLPLQSVLMFDCMAPRPGANKKELAMALWQVGQVAEQAMISTGNCDAYMFTNDADEADSVAKHGWEELKGVRLLRKRIPVPNYPVPASVEEQNVNQL
jgi:hypothetical protein